MPTSSPVSVPAADDEDTGFSSVSPAGLSLALAAGATAAESVSITIDPFCFRPFEIDVVSSDPAVTVSNTTGTVLNGCGGDTLRHPHALNPM